MLLLARLGNREPNPGTPTPGRRAVLPSRGAHVGGALPVLHVTNEDGNLTELAAAIVQAVITYPGPEDPRQLQMLASVGAELLISHPDAFEEDSRPLVALELIPHVYAAPEPGILRQRGRTYAQNAWVAGELLLFLLSAAIHHPERNVTVTKALSVLRAVFKGQETWGGKRINLSARGAWEAWSRFKSVSPFYALQQIRLEQLKAEGVDSKRLEEQIAQLFTEDLLSSLAAVEALRRAAVERKILDFDGTWRVADNTRLPPAEIGVPPLPRASLDALDAYVPEHSNEGELD